MIATTLRQVEERPATRLGLTVDGAALAPELADAVWARIEAWCAHRWTARAVVWIVEGPGAWSPPLAPARMTGIEIWQGEAWQAIGARVSPLGGYELEGGLWRLSGVAGEGNPPPPAVAHAAALLAAYWRQRDELRGLHHATRVEHVETFGGEDSPEERLEVERPVGWLPRALHLSGAADALRP